MDAMKMQSKTPKICSEVLKLVTEGKKNVERETMSVQISPIFL